MKPIDIAHWRLHNLRLSGAPFSAPEDAVRWLGAVQSQDFGLAKWSVAQRTTGVDDAAMDRAFAEGTILRTHVLRPTWHFVLPDDIRWMLELTAPRVHALNAYQYRQLEKKCTKLLVDALRGGNWLTRKELQTLFERAGVATNGFRLVYILMYAELNGIICSGPLNGKQHTYALLEERAPPAKRLTRDEALASLTLRYFTSHGPATKKDFRWWSSLTAADVENGLAMVGSHLQREVVGDTTYWFALPAPTTRDASPTVHLLQGFDEYLVGYGESKFVHDVSGTARSRPQHLPTFNHVVILDSQVVGLWKRTLRRRSVFVEAALNQPFGHDQLRVLQAAADRHGQYLGLPDTVVNATAPPRYRQDSP